MVGNIQLKETWKTWRCNMNNIFLEIVKNAIMNNQNETVKKYVPSKIKWFEKIDNEHTLMDLAVLVENVEATRQFLKDPTIPKKEIIKAAMTAIKNESFKCLKEIIQSKRISVNDKIVEYGRVGIKNEVSLVLEAIAEGSYETVLLLDEYGAKWDTRDIRDMGDKIIEANVETELKRSKKDSEKKEKFINNLRKHS